MPRAEPISFRAGEIALAGDLAVPDGARGLVLFAHGSGSSRNSTRNRRVAQTLQKGGLGTLLIDLLSPEEEPADEVTGELRFDIPLLSRRLLAATDWVAADTSTRSLPLGYFGASTGAAAALVAAAERPEAKAVVSRGGRPDLAGDALRNVAAPTLLIVGGEDTQVLELNEEARGLLAGKSDLAVVPGATHLFEEPGALEQVAELARDWLTRYLAA